MRVELGCWATANQLTARRELSELPQSSVMEGWKIKPNFRRSKIVLEKGDKEFNNKRWQGQVIISRMEGEPAPREVYGEGETRLDGEMCTRLGKEGHSSWS